MKNANLKKIILTVLSVMLVLSVVFAISSCKKEHVHTLEESVVKAATCTAAGQRQIKCTDEECDFVETEIIPATGHDKKTAVTNPTCTEKGLVKTTCSKCDFVEEKDIPAAGHVNETKVIKAPTCTENGVLEVKCSKCGVKDTQEVDAPGHTTVTVYKSYPSCTTQGYEEHLKCTKCSWTTLTPADILSPLGHDYSNTWTDDRQRSTPEYDILYPTCTTSGYHYEYVECTRCGHNKEYVKVEDAAYGHDISTVAARAAGCCYGWDSFEYCNGWSSSELRSMGYPYAPTIKSSGESINKASEGCGYNTYVEHPAVFAHSMTAQVKYVETKAATCETEGAYALIRECTTCTPVNQWPDWNHPNWTKPQDYPFEVVVYTEFETNLGLNQGVIAALGHEYQAHRGQAATCTTDGWEDFEMCTRCSKINTPTGEIVVIPAGHQPASDGCLLVCALCNYIDIDSENGGHKIITKVSDEPGSSVQPTCVDAGYYTCLKWCVKCEKAITSEVVRIEPYGHDYVSYIGKEPTCTTVGWNAFNACSRCNYTEYVQIPEYGHTIDYSSLVVRTVTEATCTYEGYEKHIYYCSVCNEAALEEYYTTPKASHTVVNVPALAAKCDATGHNAYSYCSECGVSIVDMITYPVLGHVINIVPAQDPTCNDIGWYAYSECTRAGCGYNNREESLRAATGHTIISVAPQSPSCTEDGWYAYTVCETCGGESTKVTRPATGHLTGTWVRENVVYATCTENGRYDYVQYCDACGESIGVRLNQVIYAYGHNYDEITGKCTHVNQNDNSACPAYYTPCLSFALQADGTMAVTGTHLNTNYTEIIIPEVFRGYEVKSIATAAFMDNQKITSVVIPDSVELIGGSAFANCKNLTNITIGSGVKTINASAFYRCDALATVYYHGTAAQWNAINIASTQNDPIRNANRVYN